MSTRAPIAHPAAADADTIAAEWQRALDLALDSGTLELPGFPEVSLQVQRLLGDDGISSERIVRLIGAEPLLAARVMSLANSAAMNALNAPIQDLRNAVARLGFDSLRAAAVAYAVAQLRRARDYAPVARHLSALWQQSVRLSATACVIAKRLGRVSPDTALFTGLVAGLGKLYLLTQAAARGLNFDDPAVQKLVARLHAEFAARLLTRWAASEEQTEAVRCHEQLHNSQHAPSVLADVLALAQLLCECYDTPRQLEQRVPAERPAARLNLDAAACVKLLAQGKSELAALRAALGN